MTTILREARIVMPAAHALPGKEHEASIAHERLRRALCNTFGGYTSTRGTGGWVAPDGTDVTEAVIIYDVAVDTVSRSEAFSHKLALIALEAGRALGQHSVYVRYPHGVVAIIEVDRAEEELSRGGPTPDEEAAPVAPTAPGAPSSKYPGDAIPGEIWRTRDGSLVAITRIAGPKEDFWAASVLRPGDQVALTGGAQVSYLRSRNGWFDRDGRGAHALDLVRLHSTF